MKTLKIAVDQHWMWILAKIEITDQMAWNLVQEIFTAYGNEKCISPDVWH